MSEWSVDQVLSLAPDASAQRAARALAGDKSWLETGFTSADDLSPSVWGLCQGSGNLPYQTCVDLTEPAYKCNCPSRKFPCKHALGLLLRWAGGGVPEAPAPGWVHEWHISRAERAARTAARTELRPDPAANGGSKAPGDKAQTRRADRVAAGMQELDRWLADQVRSGLAALRTSGYEPWAGISARLVDAQAGALANLMRSRIAPIADEPERLLGELSLLRLLTSGYQRIDTLPPDLAATIRLKVGFSAPTEEVLASPAVRDGWQVVGIRDELEEQLLVRRIWLRGRDTGLPALALSFGGPGQTLITDLVLGTELDADLCFYPGAQPLRAIVARRHAPATPIARLAGRATIAGALLEQATALAADPWLERWPVVLDAVVPVLVDGRWHVTEADGTGLPLDRAAGEPWRLAGAAGGRPVPVSGEWSVAGFRPMTTWAEGRLVRL